MDHPLQAKLDPLDDGNDRQPVLPHGGIGLRRDRLEAGDDVVEERPYLGFDRGSREAEVVLDDVEDGPHPVPQRLDRRRVGRQ